MVDARSSLLQSEKYLGFKRAFETFSCHLASKNFVGAFVVGFSVFEDRVSACFMLAKDQLSQKRPTGFVNLPTKVRFLAEGGHLSGIERGDWLAAAQERNELVHNAMWNVDVFREEHGTRAIERARLADKISKRLYRKRTG